MPKSNKPLDNAEAVRDVIRRRIEQLGLRPTPLAIENGFDRNYFIDFIGSKKPRSGEESVPRKAWIDLPRTAEILGLNVSALVNGELVPSMIAIVGIAGAGPDGSVLFAEGDGNFGEVEAPAGATENTAALEVRGTSMAGRMKDGDLIFYDEKESPSEDHMGEPCVCWLEDGRVLVKEPRPGRERGLYDLESYNAPTLHNVPVRAMALVIDIKPRKAAARYIKRNPSQQLTDLVIETHTGDSSTGSGGDPYGGTTMGMQFDEVGSDDIIGRTIAARESRGLSREDVAQKLGISLAEYRRYEAVEDMPARLMRDFCALTGVDVGYLIGISREPPSALDRPPISKSSRPGTS